jgi:hypothetical protein
MNSVSTIIKKARFYIYSLSASAQEHPIRVVELRANRVTPPHVARPSLRRIIPYCSMVFELDGVAQVFVVIIFDAIKRTRI